MTTHQLKRRITRIQIENFRLSKEVNDKQLQHLYQDIAFLAQAILLLEKREMDNGSQG